MKRAAAFFLMLLLCFCLGACNQPAAVITEPCDITVKSYLTFGDDEPFEECELTNEITGTWLHGLSIAPHIQITPIVPYEGSDYTLQLDLYTDAGCFVWNYKEREDGGYLGHSCSIVNGDTIYWDLNYGEESNPYGKDRNHISIIFRDDQHIVGYAIVVIQRAPDELVPENIKQYDAPAMLFCPYILESVFFPKVDGEYQDISLEYVQELIEKSCVQGAQKES